MPFCNPIALLHSLMNSFGKLWIVDIGWLRTINPTNVHTIMNTKGASWYPLRYLCQFLNLKPTGWGSNRTGNFQLCAILHTQATISKTKNSNRNILVKVKNFEKIFIYYLTQFKIYIKIEQFNLQFQSSKYLLTLYPLKNSKNITNQTI